MVKLTKSQNNKILQILKNKTLNKIEEIKGSREVKVFCTWHNKNKMYVIGVRGGIIDTCRYDEDWNLLFWIDRWNKCHLPK